MEFEGKRVKLTRWVHAGPCVVKVEVEGVIPVDDPSEPCYEPKTVEFLREVHERAAANDLAWLRNVGTVYVRMSA